MVSIAFTMMDKDSYVSYLNHVPSASGTLYVNDKNTLKWHQKNNIAVFTYPDRHYAKTGQLVTTNCHKY
ncbi:hypothetical protein AAUPMC_12431 [Pasteurella multocida subsp. multocida str. Anand1_cattle]|nr:hypothetical protein AAUPMC_12431 [Pasteurella multocida subsp. multocida str. Anand1_cattle]